MPKTYTLTEEKKEAFASMVLLETLVNTGRVFSVLPEGDNHVLEPLLTKMFNRGLVEITRQNSYGPTDLGKNSLRTFMKRYSEFLNTLDVYHSVDLTSGEFAMARFFDLEGASWTAYLSEDRWEDLRVAVCEFKGIDPLEIVFMAFLTEGRIDVDKPGWQFDLALGTVWKELLEVCSTALQPGDLGYGSVGGEAVLKDVIQQGVKLLVELFEKEKTLAPAAPLEEDDGYTVTTVTRVSYFDPYLDPYYRSGIWGLWYW